MPTRSAAPNAWSMRRRAWPRCSPRCTAIRSRTSSDASTRASVSSNPGDHVVLMHQLLRDGAERSPDKIAFNWVDRDLALTFAAAVAEMERFAGALHHLGVR